MRDDVKVLEDVLVGLGFCKVLDYMYEIVYRDGFIIYDVDYIVGRIEVGKGNDVLGILCYVDVVFVGDGWDSNLFELVVIEDVIIVRGIFDDKGLIIVVYYVIKILEDMNVDWKKCIYMIIGMDEEFDWKCMDCYFKIEEMLILGFVLDVEFLCIYGEKGIIIFDLV